MLVNYLAVSVSFLIGFCLASLFHVGNKRPNSGEKE